VIGIRYPFGTVVSPGNFAVYGGAMWFVVGAMRRRTSPRSRSKQGSEGFEPVPPELAAMSGTMR